MYFEIKVGSVTNASRGVRLLKSKGYKASMARLENPSRADGCGYVIKVYGDDEKVINLLRTSGISVLGVERI